MKNFIDFLRYVYWCWGGVRNKKKRIKMMKFETEDCLTIVHNGDLYPSQLVLMIDVEAGYSGLFSIMNRVLSALVIADWYGLIPVVKLNESGLYSEQCMVESGVSLFEYYFKQPLFVQLDEVEKCRNVTYATDYQCSLLDHMNGNYKNYLQDSKELQMMASAVAKFLHLNDVTTKYIGKHIQKIFTGKKILGVHVRGTDFKAGFNNHTVYVTVEEYISHVQQATEQHNYDQIFLATDEESTIVKFREAFGDKVVYHDVYRAKEDTIVGVHCSQSDREMHHYKLGLEVLLDMYSLSNCDALIACPSGVSFHALVNRIAKGKKYEYMDIIDKGRYKSKRISNVEIKNYCLQRGDSL